MVNVVLAGGGTAGHTSPLIATAEALAGLDPDGQRSAIGTPKGLEARVIPAAGLDLDMISPVPLPRKPSVDLLLVGPRMAKAVGEAKRVLQRRRADVLVGFGGYVSTPAYLAAKQLKVPIVVHEQNSVAGLANKVAARLTDELYTAYPETGLKGASFIGLPLRREITGLDRAAEHEEACRRFDLDPQRPVLLVSGGSQGAKSINDAVREAFGRLLEQRIQVLHVLGRKNFSEEMMSVTDEETGTVYRPIAYVEKMEQAYAAADLMLGRAGAGTVAEVAVVGLPSILVPLPHGNGEQARNAETLVEAGGARLLADSGLSATWLTAEVPRLINDTEELERMSRAGRDLMPANAADVLASRILAVAGSRK
ncbi:undecaprenyldiphospho-muramoylpentapeptide beta-N-acetylglucosaminyltransferase [Enemella dayhoffiae]|uniref:UDP-N-acetylglucosamine--N-acetylmuramyl-(pentapeptide) pyrophosphoryl-undecaprenol N-acetylglucosamine transferase n=1 Tax=Enemella dayhoffiae TaxID=2016507 RepID=A0A255HCH2_9ACTN|nr:undecaprenyldiphospho-muramoylpentapeptide beta-N-acetylglucosaminyltransferase [Enemella dayhoffiae]OYO24663.1 undecaprenyldiphospho-muramoylpentapeptide beta-N-acetylglucosaminyltransferase [Enemella dayhoffiae]